MSMFWKPKTKTGIEIHYVISGVEMPVEIKSAPAAKTTEALEYIQNNQLLSRKQVQLKYALESVPNLQIKYLEPPKHVEENNIDIIAEVIFTGVDTPKQYGMSWFSKLLLAATFWTITGAGVLIGLMTNQPDPPKCSIIFVEDKPLKIRIDSTEYPLNSDGIISTDTKVHMNPWHRQVIDSGICTRQNI